MKKPIILLPGAAPSPPLTDVSREIIAKLKEHIELAEENGMTSIAILAVGPQGYAVSTVGHDADRLNTAADSLKRRVLDVIESTRK